MAAAERAEEKRAREAKAALRMRRAELRSASHMAGELAELQAEAAEAAGAAAVPVEATAAAVAVAVGGAEARGSKRRRGAAVDYVALNRQLEAAAADGAPLSNGAAATVAGGAGGAAQGNAPMDA